ncbi:retrovirus-related pol polyprotein from transposon TNT 1-94 [Tanacetum coccineum]
MKNKLEDDELAMKNKLPSDEISPPLALECSKCLPTAFCNSLEHRQAIIDLWLNPNKLAFESINHQMVIQRYRICVGAIRNAATISKFCPKVDDKIFEEINGGCSRHMTGCKFLLNKVLPADGPSVEFGGRKCGKTDGYGSLRKGQLYELQFDTKIKQLRSDQGTEFRNATLEEFCSGKGIVQNFSAPYTPQQNGVAECRNRTLIEAARTMLSEANMKLYFWAEAVNTACYTQNRSIIVKRHNKTSYELLHLKKPSISHLKVFGCVCFILNSKDHPSKFAPKADEGILLGYSEIPKAYRVYNSVRNTCAILSRGDVSEVRRNSGGGDVRWKGWWWRCLPVARRRPRQFPSAKATK